MEWVTTAITGMLSDLTGLVTDNLPGILTVAAAILGATLIWRLVRRFVR